MTQAIIEQYASHFYFGGATFIVTYRANGGVWDSESGYYAEDNRLNHKQQLQVNPCDQRALNASLIAFFKTKKQAEQSAALVSGTVYKVPKARVEQLVIQAAQRHAEDKARWNRMPTVEPVDPKRALEWCKRCTETY
jgi:hypothetical protein